MNIFVTANRPRLVLESCVVWSAGGNLRKSVSACRGLRCAVPWLSSDTVHVHCHVFGSIVCVCCTLLIQNTSVFHGIETRVNRVVLTH